MDLLTGDVGSGLNPVAWLEVFRLTKSEVQWLIATFAASGASTIAYNIVKFKILGDKAPDKWSWATLPMWFLMWLSKSTLLIGVVLVLWYLYCLQREQS